ncbi:MAG: hypothetical protein LBT46_00875 [Planctomycetaceae bacterium]|jgi:hypothetical protein|nr:hypothetical protein [Planctomycetaceae bacterium]
MLNIHYPDSDLQMIRHARYHHEHPAIRKRMTILALHSQGIVGEQLCQLAAAVSCNPFLKEYTGRLQ